MFIYLSTTTFSFYLIRGTLSIITATKNKMTWSTTKMTISVITLLSHWSINYSNPQYLIWSLAWVRGKGMGWWCQSGNFRYYKGFRKSNNLTRLQIHFNLFMYTEYLRCLITHFVIHVPVYYSTQNCMFC